MTREAEHFDVASYALDILDPEGRETARQHVETCAGCAAGYRDFAALRAKLSELTLDEVTYEPVQPPPAVLDRLLAQIAASRAAARRRRAMFALAAVAATIIAIGAPVGAVVYDRWQQTSNQTTADFLAKGRTFSATDPVSRVAARVAVESTGWGTRVGLELRGVRGPLACQLVVRPVSGPASVAAGWSVPPKGYGVPGSPAPLQLEGGTELPLDRIAAFEVRTTDGRRLVTVTV